MSSKNSEFLISPKRKLPALLLCFFGGFLGLHHFYSGNKVTAIFYLLTGGICGIGIVIDFVSILSGTFRDSTGLFIKNW